jgi:hypothetical protein
MIRSVVFFIIAGALLIASPSFAESYTLMCKGGSSSMYGVFGTYKVNDNVGHTITVNFKKGLNAASPGAGECVWIDRGLRPAEPSAFRYSKMDWNQTYFVGPGGAVVTAGPLKYITDGISSNRLFYVQAYNTERGYFWVTKLGP